MESPEHEVQKGIPDWRLSSTPANEKNLHFDFV